MTVGEVCAEAGFDWANVRLDIDALLDGIRAR
jgi:hypothetical protein